MSIEKKYNKKLIDSVNYAYENVAFYKKILSGKKILTFDDFKKLPFCTKKNFEDYPTDLMTGVKSHELGVSFATTGTTTKVPYFVHLTAADFHNWLVPKAKDALTRFIGLDDADIVANTFGLGLIQPGFEYTLAAMEAGAHVYPTGPGMLLPSKKLIELIELRNINTIFATPYYAMRLTETAMEMDIDPSCLGIKRFLLTGEPLTSAARNRIESKWKTETFNVFGMAEVGVVASECKEHKHLHLMTDYLYAEPNIPYCHKSGLAESELVLTTIGKFGMPLVRYNTSDIVAMNDDTCSCTFQGTSISNYFGRSDGMIKIKGKGVYPAQIEEIILSENDLSSEYQIIIEYGKYFNSITVQAEMQNGIATRDKLAEALSRRIKDDLGLKLTVKIHKFGKLERVEKWKSKRIKTLFPEHEN
jgi:phenylacetate-CoA ligase